MENLSSSTASLSARIFMRFFVSSLNDPHTLIVCRAGCFLCLNKGKFSSFHFTVHRKKTWKSHVSGKSLTTTEILHYSNVVPLYITPVCDEQCSNHIIWITVKWKLFHITCSHISGSLRDFETKSYSHWAQYHCKLVPLILKKIFEWNKSFIQCSMKKRKRARSYNVQR